MVSPGVEGTALLYPVHCALRQQVASGSMPRGRSRGSRGNAFPLEDYQLAVSGEYHEEDGGKHHEEDESAARILEREILFGCTGDGSGGGDGSGSFVADVTHDGTGEILSREILLGCTGDGSGGGDGGMSGEYHEGDMIVFGCTGDGSDGGDGGGFSVDGFKNLSIGKRKAGGCAGSDDDGHEDEEANADDDGAVDDDEFSEANDGDTNG